METVIKDAWASSHYSMFWTSSYLPSSQTFFGAVEVVVEEMEVWTDGPFQKTITNKHDEPIYYEEDAVFALLVRQWHEERGISSSFSDMVLCPSYQRIIGMGEKAIPLILAQLRRESDDPDHWYAALEAITGEDPVPTDVYGDTVKIAEAWLLWAEENVGYSVG